MKCKARFLGTPELFADGKPYAFPFKKAQILALMLIEEKSMSRDKICEYLWADKTSDKARRNLSNAMSQVKKILPVVVSNDVISVDAKAKIERDTDLLQKIESLSWPDISKLCRPFMDVAEVEDWPSFSEWLTSKRQAYHELLVRNLKKRAQAQLAGFAEDRFEDATRCYERLTELEPYDEKIHGELVRLYIKTNQKVKAVDTARSFASRIESDFGIESDLSAIGTLMNRKTETPTIRPADEHIRGGNPLARNNEILKMLDFFAGARPDRPLCGMVWGEQGIGKTVFVGEIISCLKERGWECFYIDCWQEEKSYPMAPIMRLLKLLEITPEQKEKIKSFSELSYSYITDLIYQRVAETSEGVRRLLVIENIQWMDDASWNVIESIMCDNRASRHMLISGFEEVRSAFMLRTALADEPFEKFEITLRRFNLAETGRICREMAPEDEWTDEQIHDIYMQTEGNPFFIKELLRYKLEDTIDGVPAYKNTYLSMIELLEENERLFLEAIAVCPEGASMKEIANVLEISPLQVSNLYNNLRLHGFLREQESDGGDVLYYFTHTKIREALVDKMSLSRKTALHAKNIEILEATAPKRLQYRHKKTCSRLYIHCHEAKMPQKELFWRIRELELHFMAVHEVFPTLVDQDLMHYIPSVEDINYTQNAISKAWEILNDLLRNEGGSPALLKMERDLYTLKGGYLWWSGRYEDASLMLRSALRKAIAIGEPEPVIRAAAQICYLAIQQDDAKRLSFAGEKLYKFSRKSGFKQWEGTALRFVGIARILAGRHDEVEKYLLRSTSIFEKLEEQGQNYTVCLIAAEHFRGDLMLAQGKVPEALTFYENCINIGESVALFRGLGLSFAKAAFCLMQGGRDQEAEICLQRMGKFCNIMHTDLEDGLQGGGIAFSLMGLINCRKKDWYRGGICFAAADKIVGDTERPVWRAILCWSKLQLFKMQDEMPREFEENVLKHPLEWYEHELSLLKHTVGWIAAGEESDKYDGK